MQQVGNDWNSRPWRIAAWSLAIVLMALPISVQLVKGNFGWSLSDFIGVGILLLVGCGLLDITARRAPNLAYLAATSAALAASFGSIAVNGAVGFVGSEEEAQNLLFVMVVGGALIGAVLARGQARAMARAMLVAAVTHILVSAALVIKAAGVSDGDPRMEVVGLAVFAAMWLASSGLFLKASR